MNICPARTRAVVVNDTISLAVRGPIAGDAEHAPPATPFNTAAVKNGLVGLNWASRARPGRPAKTSPTTAAKMCRVNRFMATP